MAKDAVEVPTQRKPIGPFSYATRANGMLYVSGCIGVDDTWKVVGPDVTSQTRRTLEIIKTILDAAKVPLEVRGKDDHVPHQRRRLQGVQRGTPSLFPGALSGQHCRGRQGA